MNKKTILIRCNDGDIELISNLRLRKHTEGYYDLCFVGVNKSNTCLALIESLSQKEYVVVDKRGRCDLPDSFNICDEIMIRLVTLNGDQKTYSNNIFLKQA